MTKLQGCECEILDDGRQVLCDLHSGPGRSWQKAQDRPIISQDAAWGLYEALKGYADHDDACRGWKAAMESSKAKFECLCGADMTQALLARVEAEIEEGGG